MVEGNMKKMLFALIALLSFAQKPAHACTCTGRIAKNSPVFFIDEFDQENELTENIDADHEVLEVVTTTAEGEIHEQ